MGGVASAGRPRWGWGRADPRQDPSSCLFEGPPVPLSPSANQTAQAVWGERGAGRLVTDPGTFPGCGAGGALAASLARGHSRSSWGRSRE